MVFNATLGYGLWCLTPLQAMGYGVSRHFRLWVMVFNATLGYGVKDLVQQVRVQDYGVKDLVGVRVQGYGVKDLVQWVRVEGYGVSRRFQQYFSYIVTVSFIGGGNIMLYRVHLA